MKVTAAIVTRGRPLALIGVVMGLWRLRSKQHELSFAIGLDEDDVESQEVCERFAREITGLQWYAWPRMLTRGHIVNALIEKTRGSDVVTIPADWTFCLTPGWDDVLAQGATQAPHRVIWWRCPENLGAILPSLSRHWLDAVDWRISPEIFPFWWDDTWLEEIDAMIGGNGSPRVNAWFSGEHGKTTRGREFKFWVDIFARTRRQRIALANDIAAKFGMETPLKIDPDLIRLFEKRDRYQQENADHFMAIFGDPSPPSEQYHEAKAAALRLIPQVAA